MTAFNFTSRADVAPAAAIGWDWGEEGDLSDDGFAQFIWERHNRSPYDELYGDGENDPAKQIAHMLWDYISAAGVDPGEFSLERPTWYSLEFYDPFGDWDYTGIYMTRECAETDAIDWATRCAESGVWTNDEGTAWFRVIQEPDGTGADAEHYGVNSETGEIWERT